MKKNIYHNSNKEIACKLTLISRRPTSSQYSIENVFISLLSYFPKTANHFQLPYPSKGILPRLRSGFAASRQQGDINHITGDVYFIAPFLNRKKTIITVHDCDFIWRSSGPKRWLLYFFWLYWPVRHARYITTISEATKRDILQLVRVPEDKIRVIPNPLTLVDRVYPETIKDNEKPVLLHIGTKANKNLERLIPALAGLDLQLNVVGRLTSRQEALLQQHAIDFHNEYDLSNEALIERYQRADMLVFISTIEGFGLPIIEANALGCPVITSNCSSMPEVAGDAALLVDPYEEQAIRAGIVSLLENRTLREQLVAKGYENVKRFEPKTIASHYLALYEEVLAATT